MNCLICNTFFNLKAQNQLYCSTKCRNLARKPKKEKNNCIQCSKHTSNEKFCSRSCASTYNNKNFKKYDKIQKPCPMCGETFSNRNKYCENCYESNNFKYNAANKKIAIVADLTLNEASYTTQDRASLYALVRSRARDVAAKLNYNICKFCGYEIHVEICHIKAISTYSLDTKLSIINAPENLISLCRNHHWELDHGYINISGEKINNPPQLKTEDLSEILTDQIQKLPTRRSTKIVWPSNDALQSLVFDMTLIKLGIQLGVSDNAIKKHCKKNNITLPEYGHWQRKFAENK